MSNTAQFVNTLIHVCESFKIDWKSRVILFVVPGRCYDMDIRHVDYRTRYTVSREAFGDIVHISMPLITFLQGCFSIRFDGSWLRVNITQNSVSYEKRKRSSDKISVY